MGSPSQAQIGLAKFGEGFFGGLVKERQAESAANQKAAYLQSMMDRAEAAADARRYNADRYGETRQGVADTAAAAKIKAAQIAADAAKKNAGARKSAGVKFDTAKAMQEAMRAAGDPRASGKITGMEDFSDYTPEKAAAFNAAYKNSIAAHNAAYPESQVGAEDYLIETEKATPAPTGWTGLFSSGKPAKYGINPKRGEAAAPAPKSKGALRLEALGIQATP